MEPSTITPAPAMTPSMTPTYHVLVIAHPDDESMFFIPTIRALVNNTNTNTNNSNKDDVDGDDDITPQSAQPQSQRPIIVWLICMTTGNYDGLGTIRCQELHNACLLLGIQKVIIVNDSKIQDHPTQRWNSKEYTSSILQETLQHHITMTEEKQEKQQQQEMIISTTTTTNPQRSCHRHRRVVLITFDEWGVSGHVNHKDTYSTVLDQMMKQLTPLRSSSKVRGEEVDDTDDSNKDDVDDDDDNISSNNSSNSIKLHFEAWQLESEQNFIQKYVPLREWILFVWYFFVRKMIIIIMNCFVNGGGGDSSTSCYTYHYRNPNPNDWTTTKTKTDNGTITIRCHEPWLNWKAMATHTSQFVWYRRLFVIFSCYTFCNKLRPMTTTMMMSQTVSSQRRRRRPKTGQKQEQTMEHDHQKSDTTMTSTTTGSNFQLKKYK